MNTRFVSVPLSEAKSKLSELVDRAGRGEEFVITRHGAAIARLIQSHRLDREDVNAAIAKMRANRTNRAVKSEDLSAWKTEGRN